MGAFTEVLKRRLDEAGGRGAALATEELYGAVGGAVMDFVEPAWKAPAKGKAACYFSAEFLVGRLVHSNLLNLGVAKETAELLQARGIDLAALEEVDDDALGNGGLGRLAACFLDSAATCGLRLDGYGIRYKYGLFKQSFEQGFQREAPDDWQRFGDPFSVCRRDERVLVRFGDCDVWAVPYDMPVIGYGGAHVNTLRLWQAEAACPPDFGSFNRQDYEKAYAAPNSAEALHSFLYPNDDTEEGKRLRLKQQYFFSSASVQSVLRAFVREHGKNYAKLPEVFAIQLNDTHPTVAIPELLRLLVEEGGLDFEEAFAIGQKVFAYTNHTIMAEALEQWDKRMFAAVLPNVWPYVVMLQNRLRAELRGNATAEQLGGHNIVDGDRVHMARMAIYATHSTNGVAALHTEILKTDALKNWYALYPERFNNKTNGVTQRRWLALCNPELAARLDDWAGPAWVTDLDRLAAVRGYAEDGPSQAAFLHIKAEKKRQLAAAVKDATGVAINPDSVFDIQIKRLHEYKRQLLNAFSIYDMYLRMKDGELGDVPPVTFLFGAKAAPGYYRAKGIIKYINEIARLVDKDKAVRERLQVLFVPDYNVSWAEKLIPAADVSEQISTAGTEASGTGNMKLMMNGAVTLGTWDGANIEIFEAAGAENNYEFGARVEELRALEEQYDPAALCAQNPRLARVVNSLVDGTFDDGGTGMFAELHRSLLRGAAWHKPDQYYLLHDFEPYVQTKLKALRDWTNREAFAKKALCNIAGAGKFSSDRTIRQYADEIWGLAGEGQ